MVTTTFFFLTLWEEGQIVSRSICHSSFDMIWSVRGSLLTSDMYQKGRSTNCTSQRVLLWQMTDHPGGLADFLKALHGAMSTAQISEALQAKTWGVFWMLLVFSCCLHFLKMRHLVHVKDSPTKEVTHRLKRDLIDFVCLVDSLGLISANLCRMPCGSLSGVARYWNASSATASRSGNRRIVATGHDSNVAQGQFLANGESISDLPFELTWWMYFL